MKKNGKILKTYDFSGTIDYFEIDSTLSGFRKKLQPKLDGNYLTSMHRKPFKLRIEDNRIHIDYLDNGVTYSEEVITANEGVLVIRNDRGFQYTYKTYEPIEFDE